ncbi:hypothetical protein [Klebsiella oxytoca]|uniref:hypothetical protein n=1 Tax=Klebsiella oxytoca TaxID=571 RepID=UPI00190EFF63|nr:hypothetical protein [Klebsiella oxytoca]
MKIFHGTRANFTNFSVNYPGTGEGGRIHAIWFTDNFKGAKNHALFHARQPGPGRVYECVLSADALILKAGIPLYEQSAVYKAISAHLPVSISVQKDYDHLFSDYHRLSGKVNHHSDVENLHNNILMSAGIDAIYDYEGCWTDAYLHGCTTVVLSPDKIKILEIHDLSQI